MVRGFEPADPVCGRFRVARLFAQWRVVDTAVGWLCPDVLPASRHLVDQLRLPLFRQATIRHQGPLNQRRLVGNPNVRRVVAPQSPRVSAFGRPGPRAVGA